MLVIIVNLEPKHESDILSIIPGLAAGTAFIDHPKLTYLKQEILFSGTTFTPKRRDVTATEYSLEIETNPSLEKRIRQALVK